MTVAPIAQPDTAGEGGAGVAGDGRGRGFLNWASPSSPSLRSDGPPPGGHRNPLPLRCEDSVPREATCTADC